MKTAFLSFMLAASFIAAAQGYSDSLRMFRHNYVTTHEVVKGADAANLQFYEINPSYSVVANFEKIENSPWFQMKTSGTLQKMYRVYGVAKFNLNGQQLSLNIYQSQDLLNTSYASYLFLPFTDATNGNGSYISGRYIDLKMDAIQNGTVKLDFNRSYNPYCAYVDGVYNCPIPPKENHLPVAITAGERNYVKE
jgi:uncharacterized protein (DUF1684 family)